jgi:hypothetical protein
MRTVATLLVAASLAAATPAGELRDPMRPPGATAAAPRAAPVAALKLEGVIAGADMVAIINGRVLRTGESIAGAKVIEISTGSVRVLRAGRLQTLELAGHRAVANVSVARSVSTKKSEAKLP